MTDNPGHIHVPVGTGATGREALRKFYMEIFIPQMPSGVELELQSRNVGQDRIIDELDLHLTHSVQMGRFVPGVEPTGRRLAVPYLGIIAFENGKMASEHIDRDQATVLVQIGVLDLSLAVVGADLRDRRVDPGAPSNRLIERRSG